MTRYTQSNANKIQKLRSVNDRLYKNKPYFQLRLLSRGDIL